VAVTKGNVAVTTAFAAVTKGNAAVTTAFAAVTKGNVAVTTAFAAVTMVNAAVTITLAAGIITPIFYRLLRVVPGICNEIILRLSKHRGFTVNYF
jgi:hypothetical protein